MSSAHLHLWPGHAPAAVSWPCEPGASLAARSSTWATKRCSFSMELLSVNPFKLRGRSLKLEPKEPVLLDVQAAPMQRAPGSLHAQTPGQPRDSALSSCRVDTIVDLLEMATLKQSGAVEQRLASLEEQVGSGLGPSASGDDSNGPPGQAPSVTWLPGEEGLGDLGIPCAGTYCPILFCTCVPGGPDSHSVALDCEGPEGQWLWLGRRCPHSG